jgi:hypothetical protein
MHKMLTGSATATLRKPEILKTRNHLFLLLGSLILALASYWYNTRVLGNQFMSDQYITSMIVEKITHPQLYPTDLVFGNQEYYSYYTPSFIAILRILYSMCGDMLQVIQFLNGLLVVSYMYVATLIFTRLLEGRMLLAFALAFISCVMGCGVIGDEYWGLFTAYNSSARSVYTVLLLIIIYLHFGVLKRYSQLTVNNISGLLLGLAAIFHPPTGAPAAVIFILASLCWQKFTGSIKFRQILIQGTTSALAFATGFSVFLIPYIFRTKEITGQINLQAAPKLQFIDYIFDFLRVSQIPYWLTISVIIAFLLYGSYCVFTLLQGSFTTKKSEQKLFLIFSLIQSPFFFVALGFSIYYGLAKNAFSVLSVIGFVPAIIHILYGVVTSRREIEKKDWMLSIVGFLLLALSFGTAAVVTILFKILDMSTIVYDTPYRVMRFGWLLIFLQAGWLLIRQQRKSFKIILSVFLLSLLYSPFLTPAVYQRILTRPVLQAVFSAEKSASLLNDWKAKIGRLRSLKEAGAFVRSHTSLAAKGVFMTDNYYDETAAMKYFAKRGLEYDQSFVLIYIVRPDIYMQNFGDYLKAMQSQSAFQNYINTRQPEFIVVQNSSITEDIKYKWNESFKNNWFTVFLLKNKVAI